jgi:hypothetical protein
MLHLVVLHVSVGALQHVLPLSFDVLCPREPGYEFGSAGASRHEAAADAAAAHDAVARPLLVEWDANAEEAVKRLSRATQSLRRLEDSLVINIRTIELTIQLLFCRKSKK